MRPTLCSLLFLLFCKATSFAQVNLTQGLKLYLPFTGNAIDSSGNGNIITVSGPTLVNDRFGNANSAYAFDGVDDFMSLALGPGMKPTYPFTFSCWALINGLGTGVNDIFWNDYTIPGTTASGAMFGYSNGVWAGNVYNGGNGAASRRSKESLLPVPQNSWHHLAVVVNSATDMKLYFDCTEVEGQYTGTGSGLTYASGQGMIGRGNGGSGEEFIDASLDEIRFYDRALNATEITYLYYYPSLPPSSFLSLKYEEITITCDTTITLDATTPNVLEYLWSTGDSTADLEIKKPGIYWVRAYDGCAAKYDTVNVIAGARANDVFMPTAFTPDGDGINDSIGVYGLEQCFVGELYVFDRWGQVIYHTKKPLTNFWDGTQNDKVCAAGMYAYRIVFESGDSRLGKFLLIR